MFTDYELSEIVSPIARQYGVKEIYLFGSYARNEATDDSDIDFMIDQGKIKGLFKLSSFCIELENILKKKVDLLTLGQLADDRLFREAVNREKKLIYKE